MVGWQRWRHLLTVTGGVVLLYFAIPVSTEIDQNNVLRAAISVFALVVLSMGVVLQLKRHLDQTERRIDGLIVTIVIVVVVFSFIFFTLARHEPGEFAGMETRIDALYFTVATMATVGFGDVHAAGQGARSLVVVLMVFNVVFVGAAVTLMSTHIKEVVSARREQGQRDAS
jgi:voltage-gated potassium channel